MYKDTSACIEWGNKDIKRREWVEHINIQQHFAHEDIQNGAMRLFKVPTTSPLEDILTKGLHLQQVIACVICPRTT